MTKKLKSPFIDRNGVRLYHGDTIKTFHTKTYVDESSLEYKVRTKKYERIGTLEYFEKYLYGWRIRWEKGYMMIRNTMYLEFNSIKVKNKKGGRNESDK